MTMVTALLLALTTLLLPTPARAEWREATSEHFVIVSESSERQLIEASQRLEALHWLLGQATSRGSDAQGRRVRIFMLERVSDVIAGAGAPSTTSLVAVYMGDGYSPVALAARNRPTSDLYHEYAHHYMFDYMQRRFPPWYVEGFAEVVSTASFERAGAITYGKVADQRRFELLNGTWTPTARMFAERSSGAGHAGVASYGQYWLTAHYLQFSPDRRGQLLRYVNAINRGVEPEEAVEQAFPGGLEQLDRDLRSYLRAADFRYVYPSIPAGVMRDPVVRTLRPGEVAAIDLEIEAVRASNEEHYSALIAKTGPLTALHPTDPTVHALHSRALIGAERWTEAVSAADRAIALDPAHARALSLRAVAAMRAASDDGGVDSAAMARIIADVDAARTADPREPALAAASRMLGTGQSAPAAPRMRISEAQYDRLRDVLSTHDHDNVAGVAALETLASEYPDSDLAEVIASMLGWFAAGRQGAAPAFAVMGTAYTPDDAAGEDKE